MSDFTESTPRDRPDPLFLERLEAFMEKSLVDIKSFSQRENYPFEETRRCVAEWHCKYLFERKLSGQSDVPGLSSAGRAYAGSILCGASRALESLQEVSGIHSFILAVDPNDPGFEGFLGGTVQGREFWRGFRGGGHAGARTFKAYCLKHSAEAPRCEKSGPCLGVSPEVPAASSAKRTPASSLKAELYSNVRDALRAASGTRNAEMKWSNHDRLSVYGVQVVGWPEDVPKQNPSSLSAGQNRLLLELLENGTMKFVKSHEHAVPAEGPRTSETSASTQASSSSTIANDAAVEFSWVYEDNAPFSLPQRDRSDPVASKSAEEILREANLDIIASDADPGGVYPREEPPNMPILYLGPTEGATHYMDSHSNYGLIDWSATSGSSSRKRSRDEDH